MVVDQHALFREGVIDFIRSKPDIEVIAEHDSELDLVEHAFTYRPDIILMGTSLFDQAGKEMMQIILSKSPETAFVILAPNENRELLLNVIRSGAWRDCRFKRVDQ